MSEATCPLTRACSCILGRSDALQGHARGPAGSPKFQTPTPPAAGVGGPGSDWVPPHFLATPKSHVEIPATCCTHDCEQGRRCPARRP